MAADAQPVLELVERVAQRFRVGAFDGGGQHLGAVDRHCPGRKVVALARGELALEPGELLLERAQVFEQLGDLRGHFRCGALSVRAAALSRASVSWV